LAVGEHRLGRLALPLEWPERRVHEGRLVRLEPVDPEQHTAELYHAGHQDRAIWEYLPYGPYESEAAFGDWLAECAASRDPLFFAIRDRRTGTAEGIASYLTIEPAHASIEIGHIWFGPNLQRTPQATEALFLLLAHALDADALGYRRTEWKCNAANERSRRAALRLGYTFEGIFYQHRVVKGHNRDTAWFSILDREWPAIRQALSSWLTPENFTADGRQIRSLSDLTRPRDARR
jgi:RimJ/RimL family protein N-acetyltransferase